MKEKILSLLRQHADGYLSGEQMSRMLGISRSAVWKDVKQLEKQGYIIESRTKLGYRLVSSPDILFSAEFEDALHTRVIGRKIRHMSELSSTSDLARQAADSGAQEGLVVLSENQLQGRGRGGGSWLSTISRGIYLSVVLRPPRPLCCVTELSAVASCAVRDALHELTSLSFETGWPGDLLCEGRKVCGILVEASGELERLDYCIVGIGINVNFDQEDFSQEEIRFATSLKILTSRWCDRKQLVPAILNRLDERYLRYLDNGFSPDDYQENCCTIGRPVLLGDEEGRAVGIAGRGELLVRLADGSERVCWPGEVSVQ